MTFDPSHGREFGQAQLGRKNARLYWSEPFRQIFVYQLDTGLTLLPVPLQLGTGVPHCIQHRHWSKWSFVLVMELRSSQYRTTRSSHRMVGVWDTNRLTSSNARSISQHMHPLSRSLGVDPFPFPFVLSTVPRKGFPTARPFELLAHICRLCLSLKKYAFRRGLWIRDWRMADKKHV